MTRYVFLALVVALSGCALFQRYPRPPRAPPEEAARFQFPMELPAEGRQMLSGVMAKAIQLAADDFGEESLRLLEIAAEKACVRKGRKTRPAHVRAGAHSRVAVPPIIEPLEIDRWPAPSGSQRQ